MRLHLGRSGAAAAAFLVGATLLAGCGGSSGVGDTATARIRAVNAASNGGIADIIVNGAAAFGDQNYFQYAGTSSQPASPYFYIQPQNGISFTYSLPSQALPSGATATTTNYNITQDQYYTAFLIGRYDTYAVSPAPADPRFMQVVLLPARASTNAGLATLRVLDAAPDAGFTTPTVNGVVTPTTGAVNVILTPTVAAVGPAVSFTSVAYPTPTNSVTASAYQTLAPGTYSVSVSVASPGSGTIQTITTTLPALSANTVYTLVLTEPTVGPPPTYDLKLLSE